METGSIIDFYDDPKGTVLKAKIPNPADVPDFVKMASFLKPEDRAKLPDDVFALVAVDNGRAMRKYACTDKGNTALSVIYFLENGDRLPEEAQKAAAANLVTACGWYEMEPPLILVKKAGLLGAALGAVHTADVTKRGIQRHKQMMSGGPMKVGDLSGTETMPYSSDVDKEDKSKTAAMALPSRSPRKAFGSFLARKLRGQGTTEAATGAVRTQAIGSMFKPGSMEGAADELSKKSSALQPYVDITGKTAPVKVAHVKHQRYALVKEGQGRFPLDSYGDVEKAAAWFDNYWSSLHPEDRREYCIKLASRAEELGIPVSDTIKKYGGQGFAPDGELKVAVCTRMQFWREGSAERSLLEGLMKEGTKAGIITRHFEGDGVEQMKVAGQITTPEIFCEALRQFDEMTGLNHHWDSSIYDPWFSTYGIQKEAEWSFVHKTQKINEDQLNAVVSGSYKWLTEHFGQEFADALRKNPTEIFDSLPLPQKVIIMQLANDTQPAYGH